LALGDTAPRLDERKNAAKVYNSVGPSVSSYTRKVSPGGGSDSCPPPILTKLLDIYACVGTFIRFTI